MFHKIHFLVRTHNIHCFNLVTYFPTAFICKIRWATGPAQKINLPSELYKSITSDKKASYLDCLITNSILINANTPTHFIDFVCFWASAVECRASADKMRVRQWASTNDPQWNVVECRGPEKKLKCLIYHSVWMFTLRWANSPQFIHNMAERLQSECGPSANNVLHCVQCVHRI